MIRRSMILSRFMIYLWCLGLDMVAREGCYRACRRIVPFEKGSNARNVSCDRVELVITAAFMPQQSFDLHWNRMGSSEVSRLTIGQSLSRVAVQLSVSERWRCGCIQAGRVCSLSKAPSDRRQSYVNVNDPMWLEDGGRALLPSVYGIDRTMAHRRQSVSIPSPRAERITLPIA